MSILALNFTNRETYIAWRANWRTAYRELSTEIREGKHAIRQAFRENNYDKAATLQRELLANRTLANRMMELRKEAKEMAAEQYLKSKQLQAEAA